MESGIRQNSCRLMMKSIICGIFVLVMTVLVSDSALAQGNGQEQIQAYIERTEELLVWAQGVVGETQSVPARQVFKQARGLHDRSMNLMGNGHSMEAYGVSRRSRAALRQSVKLARESMGYEERVRIRAERFGDQHGQLLDRALDMGDQKALEFLRRANRNATKAREQYHQGDFKLSWNMLVKADDLMRRAARLLADGISEERLELEIERTRILIERTREKLGSDPDPQAVRLLAEAEESLLKAREGMSQGHSGRALQMTGLARQLAARAGTMGVGGPDEEAVRRQLERFDDRAERVADGVRESGSKQARDMYERSLQHRSRAAEALADGDREMAMRQVRAAHDLLGQTEDLIR